MSKKRLLDVEGRAFVFSAPSGAGKTSLVEALVKSDHNLRRSVSHTTRDIRKGERDGVDYFFVSLENFNEMIFNNEFIEHAEVFGEKYGTEKTMIRQQLLAGRDIAFDIDWQGARKLKSIIRGCISIFILPPSLEALEERLRERGDDKEQISRRMEKAKSEMRHFEEYDYVVFNDKFEKTLNQLEAIIRTSKLETRMQKFLNRQQISELIEA